MTTREMIRAQRAAERAPDGRAILARLTSADARKRMVEAADAGRAPITAVSEMLETEFAESLNIPTVRQFVGVCLRGILEEEGFELASYRVRVPRAGPFRSGSVYRRAGSAHDTDDALERMISSLSPAQAERVLQTLKRRFPQIFPAKENTK